MRVAPFFPITAPTGRVGDRMVSFPGRADHTGNGEIMAEVRQLRPEGRAPGDGDGAPPRPGMDVPREAARSRRRYVWYALAAAALAGGAWLLGELEPAAPTVDRDLLVVAAVRQGPMVRQVHGWGALVPDRTQLVRARHPGTVEAVYAVEGQAVRAGDRVVELTNPEIELAVEKAEQKFAAARGGMIALSRERSARRLALEASIAETRVEFLHAEDALEELKSQPAGRVRESELRRARERLEVLGRRLEADEERLELIVTSMEEQLAVRRDELRWVESILQSERERLRQLTHRAAGDGEVQRVPVRPGSRVTGGELLAEITLSDRLKAVVKVYASEAEEIVAGQSVTLEGAAGRLRGAVAGVEPDAGGETARVTVALEEDPPLPSDEGHEVEARIRLGTLDDALFVERPVYATADGWTTVFRLAPDSASAERVKVRFGRGSVERIEVLSGLEPGDRIVVSDVSEYDDIDCFEIE
ncbi:MAG: efflux RND transporter periplasmic adaptor subunit [Gemmatimonadota bacterium]